MNRRTLGLLFPLGGLVKRTGFQTQPPWTTPACSNVFPDEARSERERGGSRYGMDKAFAAQLGSGGKVRLLDDISYWASGTYTKRALASAGGLFYRENAGNWSSVASSLTLASDRQLDSGTFEDLLWIADNGPVVCSGSDGDFATATTMTSASVGNWATATASQHDHALVIESHGTIDAVQTITFTGTATDGTWRVRDEEAGVTTDPLEYDISTADLKTALELIYGTGNIASVTGTPATSYVVTFGGDLADQAVPLMGIIDDEVVGATVAAAHTTVGLAGEDYAGNWEIANVVTTTLTTTETFRSDLTAVVFRIERIPKLYEPVASTLGHWLSEKDDDGIFKGFVPIGRTIFCTWHARAVMAGGIHEPHVVEFSRINNFRDWDVSQEDAGAAVALGTSDAGQLPEPVKALIPHSDVCLIIGCRTSMWVLRGDPANGGDIDCLSPSCGIVDKRAWCKSPDGYLYWLSPDGLYYMANECGDRPRSISREVLPQELLNVDTDTYTVSLGYCTRYRMLQIWLTHNTTGGTTMWWVDVKQSLHGDAPAASFFPQTFPAACEPFIVHSLKDSTSAYSTLLLGGRDGYVRRVRHDVYTDDGTNYTSYVDIGPIPLTRDGFADAMIRMIVPLLPETTGDVDGALRVGDTPEAAFAASAARSYEWNATSRNKPNRPRVRGAAAYLRISNGETGAAWSFERIDLEVEQLRRLR